jgi:hypothetical protein
MDSSLVFAADILPHFLVGDMKIFIVGWAH